MRIFLAGASGVIGSRLVPLLVDAGHEVVGMTRSTAKVTDLRALGATPVVCDVFDAEELRREVVGFVPRLVMHQLTDLPDDPVLIAGLSGANARIRREGTRNLLVAAEAAGATRFIAQSVAWELPGDSGRAVRDLEAMVLDADGVVLRYGQFHGPGTYHEGDPPAGPRIHVTAAAARTMEFLEVGSGVVTLLDG